MPPPTREDLVALYVDQSKSLRAIAEHFGTSYRQVGKWIDDHGIARRPRGHQRGVHLAPGVDRDEVRQLRDQGVSPWGISQRMNLHHSTVLRLLELIDEPDRAVTERRQHPDQPAAPEMTTPTNP